MSYAQGRYVQTACGKCGFPYPRMSLVRDGDSEGLLVCRECYDPEHPQERPKPFRDPIALRGPVHGSVEYLEDQFPNLPEQEPIDGA